MKQGKSKSEKYGSMKYLKPVLTGTVVGALVITVVLMVLSLLLSLKNIPQMLVMPMVLVALGAGAFVGGHLTARLTHEKGLVMGLCCGALLFFLLWLFGLRINENNIGVIALIKLTVALVFSALGGVMGVNVKKHRK